MEVINYPWHKLNADLYWLVCVITLQWRHNKIDGVSTHQTHDCLLKRLFRHISKKTSKLCANGLCEGSSPINGEFPVQRASNTENVSIWWRHHEMQASCMILVEFLRLALRAFQLKNCLIIRTELPQMTLTWMKSNVCLNKMIMLEYMIH